MAQPSPTAAALEAPAGTDVNPGDGLPRRLGFWTAIALVIGDVTGISIFLDERLQDHH